MKLYLAGPMTGLPEFNFPAFHAATQRLRTAGYEVFSPAEHDESNGYDAGGKTGHEEDYDRRQVLCDDLTYICLQADGVALLDGWERSMGARAEATTAEALKLPVLTVNAWVDIGGTVLARARSGA